MAKVSMSPRRQAYSSTDYRFLVAISVIHAMENDENTRAAPIHIEIKQQSGL